MVKPDRVRFISMCPHCNELVVFTVTKKEIKNIMKELRIRTGLVQIDAELVLRKTEGEP